MSLKDCLAAAVRKNDLSQDEANAWDARFDGYVRAGMSEAMARERIIAEMQVEMVDRRRRGLLQEIANQDRVADMLGHLDARNRPNAAEAFKLLHSAEAGQAKFKDVKYLTGAIFRQTLFEADELIYEFRKSWLTGDRRRQGNWVGDPEVKLREANLVAEAFGRKTGDDIAERMADVVVRGNEGLRQSFNHAGGAIGKRERYGLPTFHNPEAVRRVSREFFIKRGMETFDAARMRHPLTRQPMTPADLRASLDRAYDTIRTEGMSTRDPSMAPEGAGKLYERRADHRFFEAKDDKAWLAWQKEFGHPDVFSMIIGHWYSMAKDIAAMRTFGPNPEGGRNYLKDVADKATPSDPAGRANLTAQEFRADELWHYLRGTTHTPVRPRFANVMANIRNVITASKLGAASISSLSDFGTHALRRRLNGLPTAKLFSEVVRQLGTQTKSQMARHGLILDEVMSTIDQQARFTGAVTGSQWSKILVDRVLTWNGLSPLTAAHKRAFGLELQGTLADQVGLKWGDLLEPHRKMLDRHGFDAKSWDEIRGANLGGNAAGALLYEPVPGTGATFLRPREIAELVSGDLAERYLIMIERETTFAVPEVTAASATMFMGTTRPGTIPGELLRTGLQFKGFPIAFATLHLGHVFREIMGGRGAQGASYAGALLIVMTLFGALSIQLKELFWGRDPRDMNPMDKEGLAFWGAALAQGGGLGIYGDFLFADVNRFGGGFERTVAGPAWDSASTVARLTLGNVRQFGAGERTNAGRELVNLVRQHSPIASMFYTRLAYERVVLDQLQYLLDPDAHRAFHRAAQRRRRDFGNESWWAPGETAPRRAPNLGSALGQR